MSRLQAFKGFNAANPQHLAWLKRKLANRDRYERRMRRQPTGLKTFKRCAHLRSRAPAWSPWWEKLVAMQRNAVLGTPILKTRREWWDEAMREKQGRAK